MAKTSKKVKRTKKPNLHKKKLVSVREHPRHVPVSKKNPDGITIVDHYQRRPPGTCLNPNDIKSTAMLYPRQVLRYPAEKQLKFPDADKYDEAIAIWTDYFNKKFSDQTPLDPNVVKALIASESRFETDPKGNPIAG